MSFVKLRPAYSEKLVFSRVVKGWEIKITVKFRASRRLRFGDTKRIMLTEMCLKSFGTFEKRALSFDSLDAAFFSYKEFSTRIIYLVVTKT